MDSRAYGHLNNVWQGQSVMYLGGHSVTGTGVTIDRAELEAAKRGSWRPPMFAFLTTDPHSIDNNITSVDLNHAYSIDKDPQAVSKYLLLSSTIALSHQSP